MNEDQKDIRELRRAVEQLLERDPNAESTANVAIISDAVVRLEKSVNRLNEIVIEGNGKPAIRQSVEILIDEQHDLKKMKRQIWTGIVIAIGADMLIRVWPHAK